MSQHCQARWHRAELEAEGEKGKSRSSDLAKGLSPTPGPSLVLAEPPEHKNAPKVRLWGASGHAPLPRGPCPVAMRDPLQGDQAAGPGWAACHGDIAEVAPELPKPR